MELEIEKHNLTDKIYKLRMEKLQKTKDNYDVTVIYDLNKEIDELRDRVDSIRSRINILKKRLVYGDE